MSIFNDTYYINLVLKGNAGAYAILIDKYKDMVFSICVRITGNREDAEEVAQDVFVKAYQGLAGFRATSKFSTWLYKIAYNHSISFIRKKQPDTVSIESFGNVLHETIGDYDFLHSEIDKIPVQYTLKALEILDNTDQIILTLYYREDTQIKEIAKITGLSMSNVKVRLFRGRKKLLAELEKIFKTELVDLI